MRRAQRRLRGVPELVAIAVCCAAGAASPYLHRHAVSLSCGNKTWREGHPLRRAPSSFAEAAASKEHTDILAAPQGPWPPPMDVLRLLRR